MNIWSTTKLPAEPSGSGRGPFAPAADGLWFWAIASTLLVLSYLPMLRATAAIVLGSDDMAHGLFAPLVTGYLLWEGRQSLLSEENPPSAWAFPFLLGAALLGIAATIAQSSTFARFAFLISLAGCLVARGGLTLLRTFAFPLSLLLFTFPIPDVLYGQVTQPLQLLASGLAEAAFEALGFGVIRDGNILQLAHMRLNVVEACSGLRSLVTLAFFCLVYCYFFEKNRWLRSVIVLCAIPAAIFVNMLRIVSTGLLGKYDTAWTKGTYHDLLGWSGFFLGFLLVYCAHQLLRLFMRRSLV